MSPDWAATATAIPYADLGDPQTLNLYGYVRNNPLSHADADGHCDENGICGILVGAAQGSGNFVKNTVVGAVQLAGAVAQDIGSPVPMNTGAMVVTPVMNAAEDYSTKGMSGIATAVLDQGGKGAMAIVTEAVLTGGLAASARVGGAPEAAARTPALTDAQAANLGRFEGNLPKGAGPTTIRELPGGGRAFQSEVPAKNIPGSKAVYEKQVQANGKTFNFTKTTYDPQGNIVHVKPKYQAPPEKQ